MQRSFRLGNKTALVTSASRGLGAGFAEALRETLSVLAV